MLINADPLRSISNNVKRQDNFAESMNSTNAERSKEGQPVIGLVFFYGVIVPSVTAQSSSWTHYMVDAKSDGYAL